MIFNWNCHYSEECSSRNGVNEGSCASGFGVCCVSKFHTSCKIWLTFNTYFGIIVVKLGCGGSTNVNNSYIVQTAVTSLTSPCTYEVCPCSTDICRIRYDFTSHTLASQTTDTGLADAVATNALGTSEHILYIKAPKRL